MLTEPTDGLGEDRLAVEIGERVDLLLVELRLLGS
jgi:hypothetical protein